MKLTIEPFDYKHAVECIDKNVDVIIIGNENFASRISYSFNESEIIDLVNIKNKTQIWVKVNKFFFEQEIDRLLMYLRWLSTLNIDRVIFQDYAVCEINYENKFNLCLHYNPDTLVTSHGQFDFYQENNINSVFVSSELMINELTEIGNNKKEMELEILGFGYGFIMHSRWSLVSNFINHYELGDSVDKDKLIIKESLRKIPNLIYEDNTGTHMFIGYLVCIIDILDKLEEIGVDYIQLKFLKLNQEIASKVTDAYLKAISDLKNKQFKNDTYLKQIKEIVPNYLVAKGFLGGSKEILNLEKDIEDER